MGLEFSSVSPQAPEDMTLSPQVKGRAGPLPEWTGGKERNTVKESISAASDVLCGWNDSEKSSWRRWD